MNDLKMDMTCGIDVGNGYVKAKMAIDGGAPVLVDMPSAVAWRGNVHDVPVTPSDAYLEDMVNELDCDIVSPAIKASDQARILVGRRAVASGYTPVIFDINNATPKCDDSLSYQLILSTIAGTAMSEYWKRVGSLPTEILHVSAYVGVALPISDFTAYAQTYNARLMNGPHIVHVHNFEREVTVEVSFTGVEVLAEGAAAQYAIVDMGPMFMDAAIADARSRGMSIDEEETGETILSYDNTVGIDIGEGTVNFPVFRDGRISVESSASINHGYGTVLDRVVEETRNLPIAPQTRKDLAEFMVKENPNPRDRKLQSKFAGYIADAADLLARDIIREYNAIMERVKLGVDVVYVYGGGANAMRETLYGKLIEESCMGDDIYTPVIWLDSAYSRDLNRNGLYVVALAARQARGM